MYKEKIKIVKYFDHNFSLASLVQATIQTPKTFIEE